MGTGATSHRSQRIAEEMLVETLHRIQRLAARQFGLEPAAIGTDVPVSEYGIDSLGLLEFLFALEEEFQVHFSSEPSDERQTLRKLAELVEQLQRSTVSPAQPTP
jgi:acyl carrier protein